MRSLLFLLTILFLAETTSAQFKDSLGNYNVLMEEVIISSKVKMKVSSDTFTYTVDSFVHSPNSYAEDVLKNLPGVNVSMDGKIMFQGHPVEYIYINGREYLIGDLRNITRNMPSDVLDKIQLFDWRSLEDAVVGNKNRDGKKALNLIFKKEYTNAAFGSIKAGAGNKKTYDVKGLNNYYSDAGINITAVAGTNRIGMISENTGTSSRGVMLNKGLSDNTNANLNISVPLSDRMKVNVGYDFDNRKSLITEKSVRKTFLPNQDNIVNTSKSEIDNLNKGHKLWIGNVYNTNRVIIKTHLSLTNQSMYNSGDVVDTFFHDNAQDLFQQFQNFTSVNTNKQWTIVEDIIKTFRKKRRVVSLKVKYLGTDNVSEKEMTFLRKGGYTKGYRSKSDNEYTNSNLQLALKFSEPSGKKGLLSLTYRYSNETNSADISTYIDTSGFLENTPISSLPTQLQRLRNKNRVNTIGLDYQHAEDKFLVGGGLDVQHYYRKNSFSSATDPLRINYSPTVYTTYNFTNTSYLNARFQNTVNLPSLFQLRNVPDYTDSLNIYVGNPDLKAETYNTLSLSFNKTNIRKSTSFWVTLDIDWAANKIVSSTTVGIDKQTTTPVNTKGNYDMLFASAYSLYLLPNKIKAELLIEGDLQQRALVANSIVQKNRAVTVSPGMKLNYYLNGIFQGSLMYYYSYLSTFSSSFSTYSRFHCLSNAGKASFKNGLSIGYDILYFNNAGIYQSANPLIMNVSGSYSFKRIAGLMVEVSIADVFNNNTVSFQNLNENYYELRTTNRLGRYALFSLKYRFNYFPSNDK